MFLDSRAPFFHCSFLPVLLSFSVPFSQCSFIPVLLSSSAPFFQISFCPVLFYSSAPFFQLSFIPVLLSSSAPLYIGPYFLRSFLQFIPSFRAPFPSLPNFFHCTFHSFIILFLFFFRAIPINTLIPTSVDAALLFLYPIATFALSSFFFFPILLRSPNAEALASRSQHASPGLETTVLAEQPSHKRNVQSVLPYRLSHTSTSSYVN